MTSIFQILFLPFVFQDILALICHTKPLDTSLRYLLEQVQRVQAANGLNSALRGYSYHFFLALAFGKVNIHMC